MGGLLTASIVSDSIAEETNDPELRVWLWKHYGTTGRAMYTMFEMTLSGCWPNYVRPLLDGVSWGFAIFVVIYVVVVIFAVIRIMTAIFLKETLDAASEDSEMMIAERAMKKEQCLDKLRQIFVLADTSSDGFINRAEFRAMIKRPAVQTIMQKLDLEVHETEALFQLLDDGDGEITHDEFIRGIWRLKGQARSVDLIKVQIDSERMLAILDQVSDALALDKKLPRRLGTKKTDF
jgi:hypothetical protein